RKPCSQQLALLDGHAEADTSFFQCSDQLVLGCRHGETVTNHPHQLDALRGLPFALQRRARLPLRGSRGSRAELVSAVSGRSAGHRAGFERGGRKMKAQEYTIYTVYATRPREPDTGA